MESSSVLLEVGVGASANHLGFYLVFKAGVLLLLLSMLLESI